MLLGITDGAVVGLVTCGAILTAGFGAWLVVTMGKQSVETAKLGGSNEALATSVKGLADIVERVSNDLRDTRGDVRALDGRLRQVEIGGGGNARH